MMAEERNKQPASQKTNTTHSEIRNVKEARELFAAFVEDERELNHVATSFVRLGDELSGRTVGRDERGLTLQKFYEQITLDPATNMERSNDDKAAMLQRTLDEMREQNLAVQSSPQARQAHLEVHSYTHSTDDLRALYEVPEDRTRAEHANYLNQTNQEARHLFERGAGLYGDTLIIPREASGTMERAEQVRLGSLAYAVREFVPLIGEEQAKIKADEFVELGKQIAGRTADGDTRLVTFRAFYQEIKKDEQGRARTRTEQAEQLEPTLERMRVLAAAMREQEWKHEPHEFVSLEDWERGLEEHQLDAERETHGHLTFHLDELFDADRNEEREEKEHAEIRERDDERAVIGGSFAQVEYERIPLNHTPPGLPENLTTEDEERLRYAVIPRLDRQIEAGVRPQDIMRGLSAQAEKETRRAREQEIARVLLERAPDANQEHPLTREEEVRALYTLRALGAINTDEIEQRGFAPHERAAAIDIVGGRLAQDYRDEMHKLKTFADLESERGRLNDEALQYREAQRATPEFQLWLAVSRAQERDNHLSELDALTKANNARFTFISKAQSDRTNYPELIGEPRPLSLYAKRRTENENVQREVQSQLQSLLVSPDIERTQVENTARIELIAQRFSRIIGRDIVSTEEARSALAPQLLRTRAVLDSLAQERSTLSVERIRYHGRHPNPLYVSIPAQSGLRLPIESINEYRTLANVAERLDVSVHAYTGWHGREITGFDAGREQELNFARDYVAYRQLDDTTRLLNSHRLFREFNARLGTARTADELREVIKEIRQENYAHGRFPERYQSELNDSQLRGEQTRRAMTETEMRTLLLSPAPAHYTAEMRELRLNHSVSARDKAERIKGLEQGTLAPSPSLKLLLAEFGRTKSDNPAQHGRNIKSFLADYLNPPGANRNRFSAHNLYDLRLKLAPVERDYLFKVIDSTKQAVISGGIERQHEAGQNKLREFNSSVSAKREREPIKEQPIQREAERNELRERLEERVSAYLVSVIGLRGVSALESSQESLHHAAQVTSIIKNTLAENARVPETLTITHERIAHIAGKLVGEMPYALREERARIINQNHTHALTEPSRAALYSKDTPQSLSKTDERELVERITREAMQPAVDLNLNDEVIEQKVSRAFGQTSERSIVQPSAPSPVVNPSLAHQPRAHDLTANPKEQHMRQRALSR